MDVVQLSRLLVTCEKLVDAGQLREAEWMGISACAEFDGLWMLDDEAIRLLVFVVRSCSRDNRRNYAGLALTIPLLDQALIAASGGTGITRPELLEAMNETRYRASPLIRGVVPLAS